MPRINITEHSDTYSFQVRNNNYATVALPITAIWGPAYVADDEENNPDWLHFSAGYRGTTDFMDTFKGPNTYLGQREKSYDYALKLLAAGYDILVKRADGVGGRAENFIDFASASEESPAVRLTAVAKYPGSYGKKLYTKVFFDKVKQTGVVQVFEHVATRSKDTLLEVHDVAFSNTTATDSTPLISETDFTYLDRLLFETADHIPVNPEIALRRTSLTSPQTVSFANSTIEDYTTTTVTGDAITKNSVTSLVAARGLSSSTYATYIGSLADEESNLRLLYNQQILYSRAQAAIEELTDTISYDWDVLFCGIADDQYIPKNYLVTQASLRYDVSTLSTTMVTVASQSKCGVAFIGTPFNMPKGDTTSGAVKYKNDLSDTLGSQLSTFGELVGPWCKTTLPINGADTWVTPELAHLLLIINAPGIGGINKWWMVPAGMSSTGVVHTPEYKIKKAYLDIIQNHEDGVCLNPLMEVPGKGFTCFGNSTLWDKPLGTYNALQNLSTRLLCNRVKQRIWDVALQILFKYNNENAYSHFYAGLSPLLDEMRSVGALTGNEFNPLGYKIIMNPDIINLDRINANTVIGKVYLAVTGVIDTVDVDLFLLPPTGFMESYD